MRDTFLIIMALVLGFIVLYAHLQSVYWGSIERFAERCRLRKVKLSGGWWGWTLEGQAGSLKVRIGGSLPKDHTQIVIPGPPDFSGISIRPESQAPWKIREIEVGSGIFDETFFVAGPIPLVLARLNEKARSALIRANDEITGTGGRLEIAGGMLRAEIVYDQLPHFLPLLLKVGECFASPVDVKRCLARNATQDPEAGVRLQNLLFLTREYAKDRKTSKTLRAACSDKSPEVRLRAGRALGREGRRTLLELVESQEDDTVSAEAFSILSHVLPFESMRAILVQALDRHHSQTARACMEALGRHGGAEAVGVLVNVMEKEQGELDVFAVQVLKTIGSPEAEGPLILALQRDRPALRIAAVNALARAGSPAAVLPLKEAAERFSRDPALSQALHQAIAEIQSRLQGASPGQLSLAQAEAGQLSLSTDPAGQLSLSDEGTPNDV